MYLTTSKPISLLNFNVKTLIGPNLGDYPTSIGLPNSIKLKLCFSILINEISLSSVNSHQSKTHLAYQNNKLEALSKKNTNG